MADDLCHEDGDNSVSQDHMLLKARIQELEQLLRESARWGQYLVNRNEELEATVARLRSQKCRDGHRQSSSLAEMLDESLCLCDTLEVENKALKEDIARISDCLHSERGKTLSSYAEVQVLRKELSERWEDYAAEAKALPMRIAPGEESTAGEDDSAYLATELCEAHSADVSRQPSPKKAWAENSDTEEEFVDDENIDDVTMPLGLASQNVRLREENTLLLNEVKRLHGAGSFQDDPPHVESSSTASSVLRPGPISHVLDEDDLESELEDGSPGCDSSMHEHSRALRRECRQLRKEVSGAEAWERQARKNMEAKQGLLRLHEALMHDDAAAYTAEAEVQRLRTAVVKAADAESEARELLAAKQEMLADIEASLRESDQKCLKEAVSSVESALRRSRCGSSLGSSSNTVWHVLIDSSA